MAEGRKESAGYFASGDLSIFLLTSEYAAIIVTINNFVGAL